MPEQWEIEYDGSLVVRGQVVCQPSESFTREDIKSAVHTFNCHADLLSALKEAQETLLHNGVDTGPLPGISQRIRLAIHNAEAMR